MDNINQYLWVDQILNIIGGKSLQHKRVNGGPLAKFIIT
jgi:hypothetical protein